MFSLVRDARWGVVLSLFALSCSAKSASEDEVRRAQADAGRSLRPGNPAPGRGDSMAGKDASSPPAAEPEAEPDVPDASAPSPGGPSSSVPTVPFPTQAVPEPTPAPEPTVPQVPEPEGTGGAPSEVDLPATWTCTATAYADGAQCHCGCGAPDPDCVSSSPEDCDVCLSPGSCSGGGCPSSISANDNSVCEIPPEWTCNPLQYGDGNCHCGCGVIDMDCANAGSGECDICHTGCSPDACPGTIDGLDNAICTGVPRAWNCDERFYDDGSLCNCGCGIPDPDCESAGIEACDYCDYEGSCSRQACPGTIDPEDNARCLRPEVPAEWTCYELNFFDGFCDCGCGALDADCADTSPEWCEICYACESDCTRVEPSDNTQCLPKPEGWECASAYYGDGSICHCGCGVVDPDCPTADVENCTYCGYYGGCGETFDCSDIVEDDNSRCVDDPPPEWTCNEFYYSDDACDCGCGAADPVCADTQVDTCDFCNSAGSCSLTSCPGTIDPIDTTTCSDPASR